MLYQAEDKLPDVLGQLPAAADVTLSFAHGVASGDATSSAIVLWTRVTPASETSGFAVVCYVTEDRAELDALAKAAPDNILVAGISRMAQVSASPASDYTVKVDFGAVEGARAAHPHVGRQVRWVKPEPVLECRVPLHQGVRPQRRHGAETLVWVSEG